MQKFFVTSTSPVTLLELLAAHLPQPLEAEDIIRSGGVWYGRKTRLFDPSFRLAKGDTVRVYTNPIQGKSYRLAEEQIVFENEDLLVVYKPANLNVHAVPASIHYNLSYGVNQYLRRHGYREESTAPTRLDRPVQGLVLFPKNKKSERLLFKLVRKGRIKKWYLGILEKNEQTRAGKYRRVSDKIINEWQKTVIAEHGKEAETLFARVKELNSGYLYSIFPFTGRRHQIRFHAANYLAPVIGDRLYGSRCHIPPDEIALMCRGYNIPWAGKKLKIRVGEEQINEFINKFDGFQARI